MLVEIISIGDELLIGQVVNTNLAWMGQQLSQIGAVLRFATTVGDNRDDILQSLNIAMKRADAVLMTGGLGPTHDDITKQVVADFFDSSAMRLDKKVLEHVKAIFVRRNYPMLASNEQQALVPVKAQVLWNELGTAPGLLFEQKGKYCALLPGVPAEMQSLMTQSVLPLLRRSTTGQVIRHRTVRTYGIPESLLSEKLAPISALEQFGRIASLPTYSGVNLRITVAGDDAASVDERIRAAESYILERAGKYVYGFDDETLEQVIGRLLKERKATLAIAESCTGGLLSHRITNVSGSSEYFDRASVTYSNIAKVELLGVPQEILDKYGAVSEPCARAMAEGIRKKSNTTYGLATTGIAGPTGGTEEKPVGLVWVALATPSETQAKRFIFGKDRLVNKERFSQMALGMLYRQLVEEDHA